MEVVKNDKGPMKSSEIKQAGFICFDDQGDIYFLSKYCAPRPTLEPGHPAGNKREKVPAFIEITF